MKRLWFVLLILLMPMAGMPSTSLAAGRTVIYGPYASDSTDSGTCNIDWADDVMDRVYTVDTRANGDGTYTITEEFKNGTFTTRDAPSPGACESGSDNGNRVSAGMTGSFQGSFTIVIYNGVYDPDAECAGACYTADFIASVFGSSSYQVTTFNMHYNAGPYGNWKNASADRGGDAGDIVGP